MCGGGGDSGGGGGGADGGGGGDVGGGDEKNEFVTLGLKYGDEVELFNFDPFRDGNWGLLYSQRLI